VNFGYDPKGRLTSVKKTDATITSETDYGYDPRGNLNLVTQVSTTPGTPANIVQSAIFPSTCTNTKTCNQPTSVTDARGNTTDFTYDSNSGQVATVTLPAPTTGAVRPQTRHTYTQMSAQFKNGSGQTVSGDPAWTLTGASECQTQLTCAGTADEVKTSVTRDVNQGLLPTSFSKGDGTGVLTATTAYTYTGLGSAKTLDGPLAGTADTMRDYYDTMGRSLGSIGPDPDGGGSLKNRAMRITYDNDGRPATTDIGTAAGQGDNDLANMTSLQQQIMGYDGQGRIATLKTNAGGATYNLAQMSYSAAGAPDCVTVRMNPATFGSPPADACAPGTQGSSGPDRIAKFGHDVYFRPTTVTRGYGTTDAAVELTKAYDSLGRLSTVKDAENNLTTYEYDGMNRLSKTRYPLPTKGSNASSMTDYEQLTYDANSNVITRRLRDTNSIASTYDKLNHVMLKNLPGTEPDVSYAYDNLGRLTSASQTGNALSFAYDALSRNLAQTGPNGTVTSQWDLAGRRIQVTYPGTGLYLNYDYLTTGEILKIRENGAVSGVGVLANYDYYDLGNRKSLTFGNGVVQNYTYDPVLRLTSLGNDLPGGTSNDLTIGTIEYNPASQITSAPKSNDDYAWLGHYNVNRPYTANGLNQHLTAGPANLTYDTRGNLTSDGTNSFTYTSENLLKTGPNGTTLSYDPAMRLYQVAGASTTSFAYDALNIIADYDGSGTVLHHYVFGPAGQPIVQYDGNGTATRRFLSSDERGSIISLTDSGGALVGINPYDEYGIPQSTNIGRFLYTGQMWLSEIGLQYSNTRVYSPYLGRFLQTDPVGYGDVLNWYAYVRNDPVNRLDPLGLQETGGVSTLPNGVETDVIIITASAFGGIGGGHAGSGTGGNGSSAAALKKIFEQAQNAANNASVCSRPLHGTANRGQTVNSRRAQVRRELAELMDSARRTGDDPGQALNFEIGVVSARLRPGGTWVSGGTTKEEGNILFGAITAELGIPLAGATGFGDLDEMIDDTLGLVGARPYDGHWGPDSQAAKDQMAEGAKCPG
jgi:RHS repeat-associated protein